MTKKTPGRPYSLAFTAAGTPRRYLLSGIPAQFWIQVQARAKREHRAVRQVILTLLADWLAAYPPARPAPRRRAAAARATQPRLPLGVP
jgi:hypothetical protein